jgi:phosphoglycerol geranylgeranyltransferase
MISKFKNVEKYLNARRRSKKALLFPLLDVTSFTESKIKYMVQFLEKEGADAILVGGSTNIDQNLLDRQIITIKETSQLPVILFPGNITGISQHADAILFMSLLNSLDPYYIIGAQALGAPIVKRYGLEVLPTAYLVIYAESSVSFIGKVYPFPSHKPELVAMYALASEYLGMRYLYLEAGSGASKTIDEKMIQVTRKVYNGMIIVGGGITSHNVARNKIKAGADAIVIGNLLEREGFENTFRSIAEATW